MKDNSVMAQTVTQTGTATGRVLVTVWKFARGIRVTHFTGSDIYNITLGSHRPGEVRTYKVTTKELPFEASGLGLNFNNARKSEHRAI